LPLGHGFARESVPNRELTILARKSHQGRVTSIASGGVGMRDPGGSSALNFRRDFWPEHDCSVTMIRYRQDRELVVGPIPIDSFPSYFSVLETLHMIRFRSDHDPDRFP
jgi:hypothetical protein